MNLFKAFFGKRKVTPAPPHLLAGQWLLVPLGNPGERFACTRHNMGRLMLQRWMDSNCPETVKAIRAFKYGMVYFFNDSLMALAPSTYMNLSGKAVLEAVKGGLPIEQMLVIYDDKDLPLGMGRLSKNGGSGGHKGLQSVMDELGTNAILRLRLGLGKFQRPLSDWVLEEWTPEEWDLIEKMDAPFATFLSKLAENLPITDLQSRVNSPDFWGVEQ